MYDSNRQCTSSLATTVSWTQQQQQQQQQQHEKSADQVGSNIMQWQRLAAVSID